jgi:hypothetical protein
MGARLRSAAGLAVLGVGVVILARRRRRVVDLKSGRPESLSPGEVERRRHEYAMSYAAARRAAADPDVMATLTRALEALEHRVGHPTPTGLA